MLTAVIYLFIWVFANDDANVWYDRHKKLQSVVQMRSIHIIALSLYNCRKILRPSTALVQLNKYNSHELLLQGGANAI